MSESHYIRFTIQFVEKIVLIKRTISLDHSLLYSSHLLASFSANYGRCKFINRARSVEYR